MGGNKLSPHRKAVLATLALVVLAVVILFAMDRPPICTCGTVELWHGTVQSSGNSQHLTDWYSPSHFTHGLIMYFFAWALWVRLPAWRPRAAPAHSPTRPPNQDNALGGRVGEWAGTARGEGLPFAGLRKVSRWALPIAVLVEAAWEVSENTPMVIDRYRAVTVSWGYSGDSIINSAADIGWMIAGFLLATRLPAWLSVALALGFELLTLWIIRDNLTLNVVMLFWPIEAIRQWQGMG